MAAVNEEPVAQAASSAGARMVEEARKSVVEVRSGGRGSGAGMIWDENGHVLTNHHVVAGGRRRGGQARVILPDGRALGAEVVRRSRSLDLALLRLRGDTDGLRAAPVGDSDALRVGGLVYAIGHPWGSLGAVTAGVVSGLGVSARRGPRRGSVRYVQSDVVLAPGNSGGPLLSARGEVVGINAMVFGRTALSVPSNAASAWAAGHVGGRFRLGVRVLPVEFSASGRPEGAGDAGLVIASVERDGPADRAGLVVGDVLLGMTGEPPGGVESLLEAVARGGDVLSLRVMRGGEISVVEVRPATPGRAA